MKESVLVKVFKGQRASLGDELRSLFRLYVLLTRDSELIAFGTSTGGKYFVLL